MKIQVRIAQTASRQYTTKGGAIAYANELIGLDADPQHFTPNMITINTGSTEQPIQLQNYVGRTVTVHVKFISVRATGYGITGDIIAVEPPIERKEK